MRRRSVSRISNSLTKSRTLVFCLRGLTDADKRFLRLIDEDLSDSYNGSFEEPRKRPKTKKLDSIVEIE